MAKKLDWVKIERTIYDYTVRDVRNFARHHQKERFYGYIFMTRDDACVYMSANTPEAFQESLAEHTESCPEEFGPEAGQQRVSAIDELKWNPGEWAYDVLSGPGPYADDSWDKLQTSFLDVCQTLDEEESSDASERFISVCFKVLVRTVQDGLFKSFPKTDDFKVLAYDFNDELEAARRRMRAALKENGALGLASQFALKVGD